jgi:hypothetical protein
MSVHGDATLAAAASFGSTLFADALLRAKSELPRLADTPRGTTSWDEAQAAVQAREEARAKLKEPSKSKGHSKPATPVEPPPQPGVAIGSVADAAPFWMLLVGMGAKPLNPAYSVRWLICCFCDSSSGGVLPRGDL